MQKSELNSLLFLSIQNTYDQVECALFRDQKMLDMQQESKMTASKNLIFLLQELLSSHQYTLSDCSFIAVNQGPGPFTTLRVVIASANGLSFAHSIPLVGVDALDACIEEYKDPRYLQTVVLLNAFGHDVYYELQKQPHALKGYDTIERVLRLVESQFPLGQIRFIGNAVPLYAHQIAISFSERFLIPNPLPLTCSIVQIGHSGLEQWHQQKGISYQLFPLYLKRHEVER